MPDDEVGYGRPPKHSRFRKGVCPNPRGRPRRERHQLAEAAEAVLQAKVLYCEGGKMRQAARCELSIRRLFTSALSGNARDAVQLLRMRQEVARTGRGPLIIEIIGGLPDGFSKEAADAG